MIRELAGLVRRIRGDIIRQIVWYYSIIIMHTLQSLSLVAPLTFKALTKPDLHQRLRFGGQSPTLCALQIHLLTYLHPLLQCCDPPAVLRLDGILLR